MLTYPTSLLKMLYLQLQKLMQGEQVNMSEAKSPAPQIRQPPVFETASKRLSQSQKDWVDLEIEKISMSPEVGQQKQGDLSHLWVHKFELDGRETLLGYSWQDYELVIFLLNLGPHENFYRDVKKRRKADLDVITSSTGSISDKSN